jgi:hypothetical protein
MSRRRRVGPTLAVVAALAVVVALTAYFLTRGNAGIAASGAGQTSSAPVSSTVAAPTEGVVETDAAASSANPSSGQTVATDPPQVVDGNAVSVEVTTWGWNAAQRRAQVRGYVAGVVEDGGTCTLTLAKDGRQVTADAQATPDASTTACGSVAVPGDQLTPGVWQAVLSYASPQSKGSAPAVAIEVTQ